MNSKKPKLTEGFLTTFTLKTSPVTDKQSAIISQEIKSLIGIDRICFFKKTTKLKVTYDASLQSIDTILTVLEKHDVQLERGWWNNLKLAWARNVDGNIKDNAASIPHCCNKPPTHRLFHGRIIGRSN